MNPTTVNIDINANLTTLERIASLAGNARRLEYETAFFKAALRTVPPELLGQCELIGVERIQDAKNGSVRVQLFGANFDIQIIYGHEPDIYHSASLPLTARVERLEDYSFERSVQIQRELRSVSWRSWRPSLALAAITAIALMILPLTIPWILIPVLLICITGVAMMATTIGYAPPGVWRIMFPKRMTVPDSVSLDAFEAWRSGNTLETRGDT